MLQMAGVGLLVEVVAHELARSTENALAALEALRGKEVPDQISGLLNSLRSEITSVSKRVRVLDPLSVSGRQRKETFNLISPDEGHTQRARDSIQKAQRQTQGESARSRRPHPRGEGYDRPDY